MVGPAASVVIPAHNEEAVIGRCLEALRSGVPRGCLEIVVVCNGCVDATAEKARAADVTVLVTPRSGKSAALNLGDESLTVFPRFYVDADVRVTGAALLAVADVLRDGGALAASPRLTLDMAGVSRLVRSYYRIWTRLPYVISDHIGSGVVGLAEKGRARFDRFPDAIADDYFLHALFAPGERRTVDDVTFTVYPARTLRALVIRMTRVYAGNMELRRRGLVSGVTSGRSGRSAAGQADWLRIVMADPRLIGAVPAYLSVALTAKVLARRKVFCGNLSSWERDDTSRTSTTGDI